MGNEDEDDDEEEEEIALDLEEVEAVSKKARQDEEIHTEHMQVLEKLKANQRRDYLKVCLHSTIYFDEFLSNSSILSNFQFCPIFNFVQFPIFVKRFIFVQFSVLSIFRFCPIFKFAHF